MKILTKINCKFQSNEKNGPAASKTGDQIEET